MPSKSLLEELSKIRREKFGRTESGHFKPSQCDPDSYTNNVMKKPHEHFIDNSVFAYFLFQEFKSISSHHPKFEQLLTNIESVNDRTIFLLQNRVSRVALDGIVDQMMQQEDRTTQFDSLSRNRNPWGPADEEWINGSSKFRQCTRSKDIEVMNEERMNGNRYFKCKEYEKALECYNRAILKCPTSTRKVFSSTSSSSASPINTGSSSYSSSSSSASSSSSSHSQHFPSSSQSKNHSSNSIPCCTTIDIDPLLPVSSGTISSPVQLPSPLSVNFSRDESPEERRKPRKNEGERREQEPVREGRTKGEREEGKKGEEREGRREDRTRNPLPDILNGTLDDDEYKNDDDDDDDESMRKREILEQGWNQECKKKTSKSSLEEEKEGKRTDGNGMNHESALSSIQSTKQQTIMMDDSKRDTIAEEEMKKEQKEKKEGEEEKKEGGKDRVIKKEDKRGKKEEEKKEVCPEGKITRKKNKNEGRIPRGERSNDMGDGSQGKGERMEKEREENGTKERKREGKSILMNGHSHMIKNAETPSDQDCNQDANERDANRDANRESNSRESIEGDSILPILLANRSAVYLHLKHFEDAIADIEESVRLGYQILDNHNILTRMITCLKFLGRDSEAECVYRDTVVLINEEISSERVRLFWVEKLTTALNQVVPRLSINSPSKVIREDKVLCGRNLLLPSASEFVYIHHEQDKGRHLKVTRDVGVGEVLIIDRPIGSVLANKFYDTYCNHCMVQLSNRRFIPCISCDLVRYCSLWCRDQSWHSYHSKECPYLPALRLYPNGLHLLRILISCNLDECIRISLDEKQPKLEEFPSIGMRRDFRSFNSLLPKIMDSPEFNICYPFASALFALLCLRMNLIKRDQLVIFASKTIIDSLLKISRNADTIFTHDFNAIIGSAVHTTSAMFNHDCDPNVYSYYLGNKVIHVAKKEILAGTEINVSYGVNYAFDPLSERQEFLSKSFLFQCSCKRCTAEKGGCTNCMICKGPLLRTIFDTIACPVCDVTSDETDSMLLDPDHFVINNKSLKGNRAGSYSPKSLLNWSIFNYCSIM